MKALHCNGTATFRSPEILTLTFEILTLTASSGYAQLIEYKIIALDTEKRPLAERVMEKLKLVAKTFLLSAILFAVPTAALKIAH